VHTAVDRGVPPTYVAAPRVWTSRQDLQVPGDTHKRVHKVCTGVGRFIHNGPGSGVEDTPR